MSVIFKIGECIEPFPKFSLRMDEYDSPNYWGYEFFTRDQFEDKTHHLFARADNYRRGSSDACRDICRPGSGMWAIPESAWDWLPDLQAAGCRIAHHVRIEKGRKQYKLVHAAPVLDLFDVASAEKIVDEIHGLDNVVWNNDTISWVRRHVFFDWDGEPPLMFQVLYHNLNGAKYRGSAFRLSEKTFVSQAFKAEYERRGLTGLTFFQIPRSTIVAFAPRVR